MEKFRFCRVVFVCSFLTILHQPAFGIAREDTGPMRLLRDLSCPPHHAQPCQELKREIATLWSRMEQRSSQRERSFLRLKLNHAVETFQTLARDGDEKRLEAIDHKYQTLRDVLQSTERQAFVEDPDIAYHHLEMNAVQEIFNRFGNLELSPEEIGTKDAPRWQKREVTPPWAGYWYPRYDPVLHAGDSSVFAKVDRMMARIGRESKAQSWEASLTAGHPESWEGLCNAWSNASILEVEPRAPMQVLGENLSISDQKALFTKVYETYPVRMFGIRYDGDHLTDGTYQDIRPEALQRLVLSILGDKQRPFIIDDTAGTEVWQQPVFRVDWSMYPDESYENAYKVDMRLWKIKMRTRVSEELTNRNDHAFEQYQYRLFVDSRIKAQEGRLVVIAGEWLGTSRQKHPDYVVLPEENGQPGSFNTWIQSNLDPIIALLRHPLAFDNHHE